MHTVYHILFILYYIWFIVIEEHNAMLYYMVQYEEAYIASMFIDYTRFKLPLDTIRPGDTALFNLTF